MDAVKVFVYGTLKKGYRNHRVLGDSKFLAEAKTASLYLLHDCGSYPCMTVAEKDGKQITGEIYEVTDPRILVDLDRLEGVGSGLYRRETIKLVNPEGTAEALGYIYNRSVERFLDCGTQWPRV